MKDAVTLSLTRAEALVFYDWLSSLDEQESPIDADDSEQRTLWKIEGQLESLLPEVLAPNYLELLDNAKNAILSCQNHDD